MLMKAGTFLTSFLLLLLSEGAVASGYGVSYQGRLLDPNNHPVVETNVQFRVQVRSSGAENCLMLEETFARDLSQSDGIFSLTIGTGTRIDSSGYSIDKIFANRGAFTFASGQCASGTTYNPTASDGRMIQVYFNDGVIPAGQWESMPAMAINFAPLAIEAQQIGGYKKEQVIKIADGVNTSQTELNNASWTELLALIAGTSTKFMKSSDPVTSLYGATLPAPSNGQSIRWNSTLNSGSGGWENYTSSGSGTVTSVAAGTGLTGGPVTTSGTLSVDVGTTAGKIVQVAAGNKLPVIDGSNLTNLTGGNITGTVALANGGTGQTTKTAAFDALSPTTTKGDLVVSNGTNNIRFPAGTNGYVLQADSTQASGVKWAAGSTGSVTSVATGTGLTGGPVTTTGTIAVDVGTTAGKIVQVAAGDKLPVIDGSNLTSLTAGNLSGAVAIANGGTGQTTKTTGFNALSPTTTKGDLVVSDGTNNVRLAAGTNGYVLQADNTQASGVKWAAVSTGGVTSVASGTGLTGGPITASGTLSVDVGTTAGKIVQVAAGDKLPAIDGSDLTSLTAGNLSGAVAIANGGTGQITKTAGFDALSPTTTKGDLIVSNGTNNVRLAAGTNNYFLQADSTQASGVKWAAVTDTLAGLGCSTSDVPTWNGSAWSCRATSASNTTSAIMIRDGSGNFAANVGTLNGVKLDNGSGSQVTLQTPAAFTSYSMKLPTSVGTNGYVLMTDGGSPAQLSWAAAATGSVTSVASGTGLTGGPITTTGTLNVDVGTTTGKIVQVAASNKLPVIDGSNLTSLTAGNLSGSVAIANGGTGQTTKTAGFDALSPTTTKGDLIVSNGTNNVRLPAGTNNYFLQADSTQASGVKWASVTDTLSGLGCSTNDVPSWNGSAWACKGSSVANTVSAIMVRDGSGNFAANVGTVNGLKLDNGSGSQVTFQTPTAFTSYSLKMPTTTGTNGYVLTTDGGTPGQLSWSSPAGLSFWQDGGSGKIYYNSGNVGIGTSAPTSDLQITSSNPVVNMQGYSATINAMTAGGTTYGGLKINTGGSNEINLFQSLSPSYGNSLTINDASNYPTYPSYALNIPAGGTRNLAFRDLANGANVAEILVTSNALDTTSTMLINTVGHANPSLFLDSAGNVGVGTLSPSAKLHVSGGSIVAAAQTSSAQCVDFSTGNIQVASYSASNTIKIGGLLDGGAYTLVLTGYTAGQTVTISGFTDSSCTTGVSTGVDFGGSSSAVTPTFTAAGNTQLVTFIYSSARGVVYASAGTNFYH